MGESDDSIDAFRPQFRDLEAGGFDRIGNHSGVVGQRERQTIEADTKAAALDNAVAGELRVADQRAQLIAQAEIDIAAEPGEFGSGNELGEWTVFPAVGVVEFVVAEDDEHSRIMRPNRGIAVHDVHQVDHLGA